MSNSYSAEFHEALRFIKDVYEGRQCLSDGSTGHAAAFALVDDTCAPIGERGLALGASIKAELSSPSPAPAPSASYSSRPQRPAPNPPGPPRLPTTPALVDPQGNVYHKPIGAAEWQPATTIGGIQKRDTTIGGLPAQKPTIGPRIQARNGPLGPPATGPDGEPLYERRPPSPFSGS